MINETRKTDEVKAKLKRNQEKLDGVERKRGILFFLLFPFILLLLSIFFSTSTKYDSVAYTVNPTPKFEGPLAPNKKLQKAEFLLKDQVHGPESLLIEDGFIYTTPEDGRLLQLDKSGIVIKEIILHKHKYCQTQESRLKNIKKCGRPLGIRRLTKELLIIADVYLGIITVDVEKGKVEIILPANTKIRGKPLKIADDLDVVDEDTIIFSDASTKWNNYVYDHIEGNPNGRIIQLKISSKEVTVLLENLYFPNGVQLFPDKQSVLIAESWRHQITRYYIDGPKKGRHELFMENLPGVPDNIRLNQKGNFYVAMAYTRHPEKFYLWDVLATWPSLRNLIMQFIPERFIGYFHTSTHHKYGLIIEVDQQGNIVSSFHDPSGGIYLISEVGEDEKYLYVGSFLQPFIAKVRKT